MATYVVPQVLVFQEVDIVTAANLQPLTAHIAGGHGDLIRYAESDEKSFGSLGQYDPTADMEYDWPNQPTGSVIDTDYVKLYIDDALLEYFDSPAGVDDTISTVADKTNQVRAAATTFKANGATYPRTVADFPERDVTIGDAVKVRAVVGSDTYDLCTHVTGFVAEKIAAEVAAATADANNQATIGVGSSNAAQVADTPENCVVIENVNHLLYDGSPDGDITETYTVTVTGSSSGGDATTATLRVTSASGNDDDDSVSPAAFGSPTSIGDRGLTVTWNTTAGPDCSLSAINDGIDHDDFVVGQSWTVTVNQTWDDAVATKGGTYSGDVDDTYIVEVTRGGKYAAATPAQITVTTIKGLDVSGPTNVAASATDYAVGTEGVTVSFDGTGLSKGDKYYIDVTAEADGSYQTLVLGHNFEEEVIDNDVTEVSLTLYIRKNIEVSTNRTGAAPLTNWTQSSTKFTTKSGVTAMDSTWTVDGVPAALPVKAECGYSNMFLEVRYWLQDLCKTVQAITDIATINDDISGELHPDNPLKWGVFKALQNANGRQVSYSAICDPDDVDEWTAMLELLDGRRDVYNMVPLTRNKTVWSAYQAHIGGQSSPEFGRWRRAFFNTDGIPELVVVDNTKTDDDEEALAIIEDDPATDATDFTQLRVPANNADFVTNGVKTGDIVRGLYTTDGFGGTIYTEFVVASVVNESTILLETGHDVAISTAQKIEVWRNLSATEQAAELAKTHGYSDKRVHMVWPDEIGSDGYTVEGYHLCAAIAGLISGVVPHQGLTRLAIAGFDDVSRTIDVFNRTQLNTMAAGGTWIVTEDLENGTVFTRHAVTTGDTDDLASREEMVVRNLDSVSFFFLDTYEPYIGVSNVTPTAIDILRAETTGAIKFLESANFVPRLGPQLIEGTINELRAHSTLKDRVLVVLDLELPFPMNNIEAHLKLVV